MSMYVLNTDLLLAFGCSATTSNVVGYLTFGWGRP
jgi:hypothetical protein